jgi:lysine-N-methylase
MARAAASLTVIHPEGRKYACRDCPARCCTSSWGIPVSEEERERILADEGARFRLGDRGAAILRAGVLPMREREGRLACLFLDEEDLLCSLHKQHGHEFIPAACQAFPFGFSENEHGQPVALLSRYCPSIRDNYGEPVEEVIDDKLKQAGGAHPMSEKMGLRSGRVLPRDQYVAVVETWKEFLGEDSDVVHSLVRIYDFTDALDESLPRAKRPNGVELSQAITVAREPKSAPPVRAKLSFGARMFVAHLLGGLCYPSRVMLAHRMHPVTFSETVSSWMNRLAWLFGWGTVRLLFVELPVKIGRVKRVEPCLSGASGRLVADYLMELIDRRQGMGKQTYLSRVIVDMALMTTLISRYARSSAAAEGLHQVEPRHVKEAIGVAELLFSHQGDAGQSTVLHQFRLFLMSNRDDFRRLLAAEI